MNDDTAATAEQERLYASLLASRLEQATAAAAEIAAGAEDGSTAAARLAEAVAALLTADLADMLETFSPAQRMAVAAALRPARLADVLTDMSEVAARAMLVGMDQEQLSATLRACEVDEAAGLLRLLGPKRRAEMIAAAGFRDHTQLLSSLTFAPGTVGEIMEYFKFTVAATATVAEIAQQIKRAGKLPPHCDKLFVVNEDQHLAGVLPLKRIILSDGSTPVSEVMVAERVHRLRHDMSIEDATAIFERYDLISAPVVDEHDAVIGRVTIDELMYHLRQDQHDELLAATGMQDEEDLYAPLAQRLRNRGFWILVNLCAAFVVSRIVGSYEGTIVQLVALASLMPIIASMAGNTGMQTATLAIRALTLGQITGANWLSLLRSELLLSLINGLFWGLVVGLFSLAFYQDGGLALVLMLSMVLVFFLAAAAGFLIPLLLQRLKGDPALGTAVIVTTLTDCLGFMVFLGLATRLLI